MKICFTEKIISPEIGVKLAGYGPDDVSIQLRDDLFMSLLALEHRGKRAVIISFDLLGMNAEYSKNIRRDVAQTFGIPVSAVLLSCTHTHCGPHLRNNNPGQEIETAYLEKLYRTVHATAAEVAQAEFHDVNVYYYSKNCDFNLNRRLISADNRCSYLPLCKDLVKLADGICDQELGLLLFENPQTHLPSYIIGNYAAHPLTGHAPGWGGLSISADYPGAFRNYIKTETGAGSMFLTGMCGNLVARGYEEGGDAIRAVGVGLAREALDGYCGATRQPERFLMTEPDLHYTIEKQSFPVRRHRKTWIPPGYLKSDGTIELEVQILSIGEICLIGMPGEMLTEIGLEIKWHSPFRRTFLLYNSTGYFDYIGPTNTLVSGGYEGLNQAFTSRTGLGLVELAVSGAFKLFEANFDDSLHPDNQQLPLVAWHFKS